MLLFVGAAHAQENKPWYSSAATACYLMAKTQTPNPSAIKHQRILVDVLSDTKAESYVGFPGERSDWLAHCTVELRSGGDVYVVVLVRCPTSAVRSTHSQRSADCRDRG